MATKRKKGKSEEVTAPVPEVRRTVSAVYPAVQVEPPVPEAVEEAPAPAPAPKAPRKGKGAASWALQLALVAVPAAISGLSSYTVGRDDSAASYKALTTAVKELQEVVKEQAQQQAYLQGEIDMIRGEAAKLHGTRLMRRPMPPQEMKASLQLSELPENFSEVVKKGPLEQTTLVLTTPQEPAPELNPQERLILDAAEKKRALAMEELEKKKREEAAKKAPASR